MTIQINYVIDLDGEAVGNALEDCDDPKQFGEDITANAEMEGRPMPPLLSGGAPG